MNQPLEVALKYVQAGISCIPIRLDGSKSPAIPAWQEYQKRLPTEEEVRQWFAQPRGIGVIGGAVSGNLECIDIERQESFDEWRQLVEEAMPGLMGKLVISTTPGGKYDSCGFHVRYRVAGDAFGCQKLAKLDATNLLAELKGEGGYALAPGGDARAHPSGKEYLNIQGRLSELPIISTAERDILIAKAIELNQYEEPVEEYQPQVSAEAGDRPGDRFNARGDFSFLTNYGWKLLGGSEGKHYWKRPGKDTQGISATTGFCRGKDGTPRLYVFSTNAAPFQDNKYYSPFSAYVYLKHNGDWKAASRDVAEQLGLNTNFKPIIGKPPAEVVAADASGEIKEVKEPPAFFPAGVLPEKLQVTLEELARVIPCPVDTVGAVMLAMASLGVGNSRRIQLKKTWSESASLYVAIVAEPGEGKTPALQQLKPPMLEWRELLVAAYQSEKQNYEEELEKWEDAKAKGIEAGAKPKKPRAKEVYVSDATAEKIATLLSDNPRGLAVDQDELVALVKGMNQYKAGGQGRDRQFYLEAWSGSPVKVDRVSTDEPKWVPSPFLAIFGGIQPQMLGVLKDEFGREDGFVHRFLFCAPPRRVLNPWNNDEVSDAALNNWNACFQKLTTLSMYMQGDKLRSYYCRMTPEATQEWKRGYDAMLPVINSIDRQFGGAYHKIVSYAARLALICQMLNWACDGKASCEWIEPQAVQAGWKLADYFASHMKAVYTQLHDRPEDMRAKEYINWINTRGGKVTQREAMRFGPSWCRKSSLITKMFQDLQDRGMGIVHESDIQANGKKIVWFEARQEQGKEEVL